MNTCLNKMPELVAGHYLPAMRSVIDSFMRKKPSSVVRHTGHSVWLHRSGVAWEQAQLALHRPCLLRQPASQ